METKIGLRVLLADDYPLSRQLLRTQLKALGCAVVMAEDGQEARAHCLAAEFDLLITDLNMPICDGLTLTRDLRARGVKVPIIGMTANVGEEQRCLDAGMNACLVKPISLATLADILRGFMSEQPEAERAAARSELKSAATDFRNALALSLREDSAQIEELLEAGRYAEAEQMVHRLKGGLAVASATKAVAFCEALERAIGTGAPESIRAKYAALADELAPLMKTSDEA
ncbi:MAG: response regulator [Betaproteobacteria bacterium]|nr:response regulator [Betaproteobacteria bacterium]